MCHPLVCGFRLESDAFADVLGNGEELGNFDGVVCLTVQLPLLIPCRLGAGTWYLDLTGLD